MYHFLPETDNIPIIPVETRLHMNFLALCIRGNPKIESSYETTQIYYTVLALGRKLEMELKVQNRMQQSHKFLFSIFENCVGKYIASSANLIINFKPYRPLLDYLMHTCRGL